MKLRIYCAVIPLALAVSIIGCGGGVQDKPLPMSQETIEKFANELIKATKSIAPTPSQDGVELLVGAYKTVIEKKMGFSFDKTVRSVMLFPPVGGGFFQLMNPVIGYVINNPKQALDKGFISQRTFDILDTGSKAEAPLTKENEEFLGFVAECQNKNNGICDPKLLLSVLAAHNVLPAVESSSDHPDITILYQIDQKYNILAMGSNKWITKPDGQEINTNGLLSHFDSTHKFVVNKNQIDISKHYANMLAEEKVALSQ